MAQLSTPTNVTKTLSPDKTKVTVSWDTDSTSDIQNFKVSLVPKDSSFTPPTSWIWLTNTTSGATKTLDFTPPAASPSPPAPTPTPGSGGKPRKAGPAGKPGAAAGAAPATIPVAIPTAEELYSNYVATVVANPKDSTNTASDPGCETYWNFSFDLFIKIGGSDPIPLRKPSGSSSTGGIYVFASQADPVSVTADDINKMVGVTIIPTELFNKTPSLTIPKLAIDADNSLVSFELDTGISFDIIKDVLTIDSFKLSVERKDGLHHALDALPAS